MRDGSKRGALQVLMSEAVDDPDALAAELPIMGVTERQNVVTVFNSTQAHLAQERSCLHELFQQHARRRPDAPCLACGDATLTYGEVTRPGPRMGCMACLRPCACLQANSVRATCSASSCVADCWQRCVSRAARVSRMP